MPGKIQESSCLSSRHVTSRKLFSSHFAVESARMKLVQEFEQATRKRDAEIGARIREAREVLGYSQEKLASMCSFSERSLGSYERGKKDARKHL